MAEKMPEELKRVVNKMLQAGESENDIKLVIQQYQSGNLSQAQPTGGGFAETAAEGDFGERTERLVRGVGEVVTSPHAGRAAYQTLGGMVGGGIAKSPYGIGLGSSMAGQYWDLAQEMTGNKPPESLAERFKTAGTDFMLDVISPVAISKGIYGLKKGGKALAKGGKRTIREAAPLWKFRKFGVEPSAGTATGKHKYMTAENALADYYFSAGAIRRHSGKAVDDLAFANKFLAREYGDILEKEELGQLLKRGSKDSLDYLDNIYNKLFSRVSSEIGPAPRPLTNTIAKYKELIESTKAGPSSNIVKLAKEITAKAQAHGGGLPWEALKNHRSKIGDMMRDPYLVSTRNIQTGHLKQIYGALTKDMEEAALQVGTKTHARWRAANKYFETKMNRDVPILEEILRKGYDEEVFNVLMKSSNLGGSRLRLLRKNLSKEKWDIVAGTIFQKIGMAKPGAQGFAGDTFSVATFLTNWNNLSPGAKRALWGGTRYGGLVKDLDDFAHVAGSMKEVEKMANKSKTGSVLMFFSLFQQAVTVMGGGAAGAAIGGVEGALWGGFISGSLLGGAPYGMAKLMTNRSFVRWAAQGMRIAKTSPNAMTTHLGRFMLLNFQDEEVQENMKKVIADTLQ